MFENRTRDAREIGNEIERLLIALDIDRDNEAAMLALAQEALDPSRMQEAMDKATHGDRQALVRVELFGLAELMLRTMAESARVEGFAVSGNDAWKAFGRALYRAVEQLPRETP